MKKCGMNSFRKFCIENDTLTKSVFLFYSIDGVAVIGYENSLDDIWKDEIHLSVTAKF